ncbi:MAG: 23S rRNA (pseudouridine(1915)-N(3))-methyltransferase RlmH [Bacteroidetes bacterium]|nr:23S rRNA (pseudouridine(1915)-N(3))-methyltransferase RlmH [Bacteroidota bacterium]
MGIKILCLGETNQSFVLNGIDEFRKRLRKYGNIEWKELAEIKSRQFRNTEELKKLEADQILKNINERDFLILLDEKGRSFNSREFAEQLNAWITSNSNVVFVVGGAFGFSDQLYNRANEKLSLSNLTFSHQLVRVLFAEQLYRAFTILRGEPYHND